MVASTAISGFSHPGFSAKETGTMNPFDDPSGNFVVLVNDEHQHSLWPSSLDAPQGWAIAHGTGSRQACLEYIGENWPDITPASAHRAGAAATVQEAGR